jgi:hypothetical protein
MLISHSKLFGVLGLALVCAVSGVAQENRALWLRFVWSDSDGRTVDLSDVLRSAPSGGTLDREGDAGASCYLRGNDLKYQLGMVLAKTGETVCGFAEANVMGVRS